MAHEPEVATHQGRNGLKRRGVWVFGNSQEVLDDPSRCEIPWEASLLPLGRRNGLRRHISNDHCRAEWRDLYAIYGLRTR